MWVIYPQRRNNFNKSDAEEYRLSPVMASPWVSVWILRPLGDKITQNQVVWLEATGRGNGSGDVGGVTWPWTGTVCVWCWVVFLLCIKSSLVKLCLNRSIRTRVSNTFGTHTSSYLCSPRHEGFISISTDWLHFRKSDHINLLISILHV